MFFIEKEIQMAAYLFASILFILSLGGLSSQESAKRGVMFGIVGMIVAIIATVLGEGVAGQVYIIVAIAIASVIGLMLARKVEMTAMPQLVAILHSFVGLAAVSSWFWFLPRSTTQTLTGTEHTIHLVEVFVGIFIGAITFTGSIIAWGKLDGKVPSKPWSFKGLQLMNLILLNYQFVLSLGVLYCNAEGTSGMLYLRYYDGNSFLYWCGISYGYWGWRYACSSFYA
jgi:NAD(P) transhydrogenase subunit beta